MALHCGKFLALKLLFSYPKQLGHFHGEQRRFGLLCHQHKSFLLTNNLIVPVNEVGMDFEKKRLTYNTVLNKSLKYMTTTITDVAI